jgi:hypothetical protein
MRPCGAGSVKTQSAQAPLWVLLHHIFAVAGTLRVPLSQPQKRHIQPARYMQLGTDWKKGLDRLIL